MKKGIFYEHYIYTELNECYFTEDTALNGQQIEFIPLIPYNQPPEHIKGEYSFLNNYIFQNKRADIISKSPFSKLTVGKIDYRRLKRLPLKNGKFGYQTSLFPIYLNRPIKSSCFIFANISDSSIIADEIIPYSDLYNSSLKLIKNKELNNAQYKPFHIYRQDHRNKNIISIDDDNTEDIDDAYCIEDNIIYIYIAEPTEYLHNLEILNLRHSTIYGKKIIPLLDKLTENKTSLFQDNENKCICLEYNFKNNQYEFYPVLMINKNKDNYNQHTLNNSHFEIINAIKQYNIFVDADNRGFVEGIMLLYNHLFAKYCNLNNIPIIYSSNSIRKGDEIYFSDKNILLSNSSYYGFLPQRHNTLGLDFYTHATSPLRRFPDFYNQLCFKNWLIGEYIEKIDIFELNRKKYLFRKFYREYNLMKIMDLKQFYAKIISINIEKKTGMLIYDKNILKFHIVPKLFKEYVVITVENNNLIVNNIIINIKENVLFDIEHYDKIELKDRICPQIHTIKNSFISN